jgi:hemerythrin-like domain-containing protein
MRVHPTDELRHEHELVLMVVGAMEREVDSIERSGKVNRVQVARMVDFSARFIHGCHDRKEEDVLFPALLERSPGFRVAFDEMLGEHRAGLAAMHAVDLALADADIDESDRARVEEGLAVVAGLLRQHIAREDQAIFPLAEHVLSDQEMELIAGEFERIEELETGQGEHGRYEALARELARQGGWTDGAGRGEALAA